MVRAPKDARTMEIQMKIRSKVRAGQGFWGD